MKKKNFLKVAAEKLMETCPGQARYLLWLYHSSQDEKTVSEGQCPYCYQFLVLDRYRVRLKPKPKLTPKVKKLLTRESKNCRLTFKETKILKKYWDSKSILLVTCKACNKTVKYDGKSRSFLAEMKNNLSTPKIQSVLKTPDIKSSGSTKKKKKSFSSNKPGSQNNSPALIFRTPTSGQSTPDSASKSLSKMKRHLSQLKMMLNSEESQKTPSKDFRNFLSSL
ncbi:UPF0711 protein C18orf21 homolog [Sarcophilus harrisii]|uniref:Chromosome 18 open reading frame 21 n=1 Tax=Sarcophilus harrisii TaxID=9305 RepID=A0A7N4Q137_SARHA|nr:UPF0711 protein C18orf21 homolog [Sarcophilus harrisii]